MEKQQIMLFAMDELLEQTSDTGAVDYDCLPDGDLVFLDRKGNECTKAVKDNLSTHYDVEVTSIRVGGCDALGMLQVAAIYKDAKHHSVYILVNEWVVDYDGDIRILGAYSTLEQAKAAFAKEVVDCKTDAQDNGFDIVETDNEEAFTAYMDGEYSCNHITLFIVGKYLDQKDQ